MKEEEEVASFFLRVDEIGTSITWLGDIVKQMVVVQKIMRTLPTRFNPKVSVLEDISDLDDLTRGKLNGILIAYEMRTEPKNVSRKVVAFKAIGKSKYGRNECQLQLIDQIKRRPTSKGD